MKERPILFSAPMVLATLEGRKGVTRRAVKGLQVPKENPAQGETRMRWSAVGQRDARYGFCVFGETEEACAMELGEFGACPYGRRDDRLWVREAFRDARGALAGRVLYRASGDIACGWKPSIHMPRWASRLLLAITAVRVERLQDGEGETAFESRYLAEGINRIHHGDGAYYYSAFRDEPHPQNWCDPFDAWRELWVSINGVESWDANPWVWVVEFKRLEVAND